jgi:hypothetical protein
LRDFRKRTEEDWEHKRSSGSTLPALQEHGPAILIISGDLVDRPDDGSLKVAQRFVEEIATNFDDVFIVPGNHDVKQYAGNFIRTEAFNKVFNTSRSLIRKEVGLHLMGIDSTPASWARGRVGDAAYDQMIIDTYRAEALPEAERHGLARVVVLHHHPLPLVEGDTDKIFGLDAEQFMYLQSPAHFLQACESVGVILILHGHRHVTGLRRFSLPSRETHSWYGGNSWSDLFVLSCPSSTGKGCDAGFNIVRMSDDATYLDVTRFTRYNNKGRFELLDRNFPDGTIRLFLEDNLSRDVSVDVEARISLFSYGVSETELFPQIEKLFRRRAFYIHLERSWNLLLYALVRTRLVWEQQVIPLLRDKRKSTASNILRILLELENFVSDQAIQLDPAELSELTAKYIDDKTAFLKHLPRTFISHHDPRVKEMEAARRRMLKKLGSEAQEMGLSVSDLGEEWKLGGLEE